MLITNCLLKLLNRKGQSIVELTLITPLLLVALYIPVDFGIALFTAHLTQNAVREAARIGANKSPFDSTITRQAALDRLPAGLGSPTVTPTLLTGGSANCAQIVQVTATGTYTYGLYKVLRMFGGSVPDSVPMTRTAQMRYEYQPSTNNTPCTT